MFFENCIDLKFFDKNLTFYQVFLRDNLNNPEAMEYELNNTYFKRLTPNVEKIILYF